MPGRALTGRPPRLFGQPPPSRAGTGAPLTRGRPAVASEPHQYSVRELSRQIGEAVTDAFPRPVWLEGELSQVSGGRNGHLYLTFTEGQDVIEAVAWASNARHFEFRPARGDRIRALGHVRTFAGRSKYQLVISRVARTGTGELLLALRERERRLEAEGLFAPERKRPLPLLPRRIGLLTAAGSEAHRDFVTHARRRFPGIAIRLQDTPVQGPGAVSGLVAGFRKLAAADVDLVVVTRGGGSLEDLLAFSEEAVVRAAAACPAPVVSAVGHEADRPLLDRAADFRASTPTAAARETIPDRAEQLREIGQSRDDARGSARRALRNREARWGALGSDRRLAALASWLSSEQPERRADRQRAGRSADGAIANRAERHRALGRRLKEAAPARRVRSQEEELRDLRARARRVDLLDGFGNRLRLRGDRLRRGTVERFVLDESAALAIVSRRCGEAVETGLERRRGRTQELRARMHGLDPKAVLQRGYSLALDAEGRALRSAEGARVGQRVRLLLARGELATRVEEVHLPPGKAVPPDA